MQARPEQLATWRFIDPCLLRLWERRPVMEHICIWQMLKAHAQYAA